MSNLWNLKQNDYIKGLFIAVITAVLTLVMQMLQNGLSIDWKQVGLTAIIAMLGYLIKNLSTDNQGYLGGKINLK